MTVAGEAAKSGNRTLTTRKIPIESATPTTARGRETCSIEFSICIPELRKEKGDALHGRTPCATKPAAGCRYGVVHQAIQHCRHHVHRHQRVVVGDEHL